MRHYGKLGLGMLADYKDDAMETGVEALSFIGSATVANLITKKTSAFLGGYTGDWVAPVQKYAVPLIPIAAGLALGKTLEKKASSKVAKKAASGVKLGMVVYGVAALVKPILEPLFKQVPGLAPGDLQIPLTRLGEITLLAGDMSVQHYLSGAPATFNRVAGAPASFDRVAGAPASFRTVNPKFAGVGGLAAARRIAQSFS